MPIYTIRWSEHRQITKEFLHMEAANAWWQSADDSEIENELDYSDCSCSDLEIEENDSLPAAIPECDCPICAILRAEMAESQREIAVYHLSDPGDHPEMDKAEFKELINQELHEIFSAGESIDRYEGSAQTKGYYGTDDMYEDPFDDEDEYFDQEHD